MKRTFDRELLLEILDNGIVNDGFVVYQTKVNKIYEHGRWLIKYTFVFWTSNDNKYWSTPYSIGATENQEQGPWDNMAIVTAIQVEPYDVTITKYKAVVDEKNS